MTTAVSRDKQFKDPMQSVRECIDGQAGEAVVRISDRGAPEYLLSAPNPRAGEPVYRQAINSAAIPGAPTASTDGVAFLAWSDCVLYWTAGTATHTSLDVTVWAYADTGEWVQVGSAAAVLPSVETKIGGVGYRRCYVQITATNGGADGTLTLHATGV